MKSPIIVAIDNPEMDYVQLMDDVGPLVYGFKINHNMFLTHVSNTIIKDISWFGTRIRAMKARHNSFCMLDFKLHDISFTNCTILKTIAEELDFVDAVTIHCSNGTTALAEAKDAFADKLLIGIEVLTSLNLYDTLQVFSTDIEEMIETFTNIAMQAELHGIVCSAEDLGWVDTVDVNHKLTRYCPGIRTNSTGGRFTTPKQALTNGADYLIIGRPITEAKDQVKAVEEILETIQ